MGYSLVARRYAEAMYDLAADKQQEGQVLADFKGILNAIWELPELRAFLRNPVISIGTKRKAIDASLGVFCSELVRGYLGVLCAKRREGILDQIAQAFIIVYKERNGIVTVQVSSAVALQDAQREKIRTMVLTNPAYASAKDVELEETIDEELIAGLVIRIDDKQIDSTFARQLADLKQSFSTNLYVARF
jgi:F-type H+-transporting ATPase subunit delta